MDPIKLSVRPASRSNLFSRAHQKPPAKSVLSLLLLSLAIALALLLCFLFVHTRASLGSWRYGIVIDGGSTGTRIHVFRYDVAAVDRSAVFDFGTEGLTSFRVNPGLSAFSEDPELAGGSLTELLEFGKGRVPRELWRETEVRLMATAGLRLLDSEVQDRILDSCRKKLRDSGFKFRDDWASVITGIAIFASFETSLV